STTTSSIRAGTLPPGSSQGSSQKRFARASGHCANRSENFGARAFARAVFHSAGTFKSLSKAIVMKINQVLFAAMLAGAIGAAIETSGEDKRMVWQLTPAAAQAPVEGELSSLGSTTEWLNSPPLTPASLRGKIVLIDFWTYTCINWLRSLPYVRAWD